MLASKRGWADVVALLLKWGANINDKSNSGGWNSLMTACETGQIKVAELLIANGANLYDSDSGGYCCVTRAAWNRQATMVKLLLSKGANIPIMHSPIPSKNLLDIFAKWPFSMAIIVLQEIYVYNNMDLESIIDLYQFIGTPKDTVNQFQQADMFAYH